MGNVYFPPENSTREKRLKNEHFQDLKETCSMIKENNILIGDFNARTNGLDDNLTREKHEESLSHDFYSRIKSQRNNQDKSANNYGKKLTDFCAATRSYIVNGRTLGDFQGKLTCHQLTGSSTVDYAIVSENLEKH